MDELEKRVKIFFNDCKKYDPDNLPPTIDSEYKAISSEYYKTLDEADEKVDTKLLIYIIFKTMFLRFSWPIKCMNQLINI